MDRTASISRTTSETDIAVTLNLDGSGRSDIDTGIGFFDHMLRSFAKHGFFDLTVQVKGDLEVDCHHTIEDTGIVLGEAIKKAMGDKKGIRRYGSFALPMDEALVLTALDLSGRPYLCFDADFTVDRVGEFDTEMVREFFYAISYSCGMNLHIRQLAGQNNHHIIEAIFKSFAKALDEATGYDPRIKDVLSTKGTL
ncbi:imidazoleglycerol-phosphate dehydratase HisB [Coprococcus catus]|uniref:imidazoleglycerol-phosphate dehydratase HisB n=1 Tax=Coprococcus catus TaxID=116085 RepID=UPI001C8CD967|nr:imidazoleglycerol-phosphate dehydratase HisB [Coprococcus catus]MBX9230003.1 imidazoleglycerol-phosphate dehydratase HisB [Coprococcus catus]MCT6798936.1 imidazoleglycerol-phosphate dehydratase HisB [Coprococcus catus]